MLLGSYVVLWILVVMIVFSNVLMLRRMRPPRLELPGQDHGLRRGAHLPRLALQTVDHDTFNPTSNVAKGTVVVVATGTCHVCHELFPVLRSFQLKRPDLRFALLMLAEDQDIRSTIEDHRIDIPVFKLTPEHLEELNTRMFPFAYYLSPEGIILAKGVVNGEAHLRLLVAERRYAAKQPTVSGKDGGSMPAA